LNKTQELARFLLWKSGSIDFIDPAPILVRTDSRELRKRILELSAKEARKLGIGKSMVHYLKRHARDRKPFKIYKPVLERLRYDGMKP